MNDEELDKLVKKSPYHKATSRDVDWLNKVRMPGRIPKWVDHFQSGVNLFNFGPERKVKAKGSWFDQRLLRLPGLEKERDCYRVPWTILTRGKDSGVGKGKLLFFPTKKPEPRKNWPFQG